jgi:MoaA/NifB/PqqE/SkfB family radical SAM enzyme
MDATRAASVIFASRLRGRRVPFLVGAALTDRCDGRCIYCRRAGPAGRDMDTGTWLELIDGMARAGTRHVSFTGGEPLMREDVGRLLFAAHRHGIKVNLSTNGGRLPDSIDEIVQVDSVTVSLDGPRDVMDALRGEGAHGRAVRGIEAALSAGVPTTLHATLTGLNVNRVEDIVAEARRLGARISLAPLRPVPLGSGSRSLIPGREDFRGAVERLEALVRGGDRTVLNSRACLAHLARWPDPTPIACTAGRIYARLEADGSLYACGDEVVGGSHQPAATMGFGEAFRALEPSSCTECWCDTRIEMNLVYALDPRAVLEAASR